MPPLKIEKTPQQRLYESNVILGKLIEEVKVPETNLSVILLKKRMGDWVRDGRLREDRIPLVNSDRYILYRLPRWQHQQAEVTLRKGLLTHYQLPADLAAEASVEMNSVPPSGPSHPSPVESTERSHSPCAHTDRTDQSGGCSSPCPQSSADQS